MDRAGLRALQAPLKERYREDPDAAVATVSARGSFADPGITATIETWAGPIRTGLHPATGGDGGDACSADFLLQALLGCAGVTLRSVATAMGVEIRSAELRAEAVFDARGTLGIDRAVPVGVMDVVVTAIVDTDADDAALERLRTGTERFCVVAQSLAETPEFVVERAGG
ncbi:OsmC family protein [Agromyces arachidis]|uniref:OsmC family protein n=1 Tax=Agromyces arachidis TaxID=766966 RepID=UPI004056B51C